MNAGSVCVSMILVLSACGNNEPSVEKRGDKTTITLPGEDGKKVSITTSNTDVKNAGSVSINTPEGSFNATAGNNAQAILPSFMPLYPGAIVTGSFSTGNGREKVAMTTIETHDGADKLVGYYKPKLEAAGYKITSNIDMSAGSGGDSVHGFVAGNGGETISVMATEKEYKTTTIVTDKVAEAVSK